MRQKQKIRRYATQVDLHIPRRISSLIAADPKQRTLTSQAGVSTSKGSSQFNIKLQVVVVQLAPDLIDEPLELVCSPAQSVREHPDCMRLDHLLDVCAVRFADRFQLFTCGFLAAKHERREFSLVSQSPIGMRKKRCRTSTSLALRNMSRSLRPTRGSLCSCAAAAW
jgi:hypothetical protein